MAVEKTITQSAEIVPFGMPRVEMPANAALDDDGFVAFVVNTAAGPVRVKAYWNEFECRGKAPALIAAGLTRAEWFPGLPGNQKSRLRVIFDSTGPKLYAGRGGSQKETRPHITVCKYSSSTFSVEVSATQEQCKRLEVFHKQRDEMGRSKVESVLRGEREKRRQDLRLNRLPDELRGIAAYALEVFETLLSEVTAKVGVHYADDVVKEVELHLDAIRLAFSGGKILPVAAQYRQDGNVVYFPGAYTDSA